MKAKNLHQYNSSPAPIESEYEKILKYPLSNLLKYNGIINVTLIKKINES